MVYRFKRVSTVVVYSALILGALSSQALASTTTKTTNTSSAQINGRLVYNSSTTKTTILTVNKVQYIPVTDAISFLHSMNVTSTWDGTDWLIQTPYGQTVGWSNGKPKNMIYIFEYSVNNVFKSSPTITRKDLSGKQVVYFPIQMFISVLNSFGLSNHWDGKQIVVTRNTTPTSDLPDSAFQSGVVSGIHTKGNLKESWMTVTGNPKYDSVTYVSGANRFPISLNTNEGFNGEAMIQVTTLDDPKHIQTHTYSEPIKNGQLSATIVLPFHGNLEIAVSEVLDTASFKTNCVAQTYVDNFQPTLSDINLGLLQSWMVNYNENEALHQLAETIISSIPASTSLTGNDTDSLQYKEIKAVSDWVSQNVAYNWPAYKSNSIPWQQITDTYASKVGVCQDISSLTAGLLRSIGIPTRVFQGEAGGALGEGSHQWNESWDGTRWVVYDPTFDQEYYGIPSSATLPAGVDSDYFDSSKINTDHSNGVVGDW